MAANTGTARNRIFQKLPPAVWLLIAGTFAIHLGSYMVIPYLMVLLPQNVAVSTMAAAGLVFVVKLSVKGSSLIGGPLADRFGTRRLMVAGMVLRGIGMMAFALTRNVGWLFAMSMVAGLGSGLYAPATRGAIGFLTPKELHKQAFSLRAAAANLGMAGAPLMVFLLAGAHANLIFWLAGTLFIVMAVLTLLWLPEMPVHTSESLFEILRGVAGDRRWLLFGLLSIGSFSLYGHVDTTIMVWANRLGGLGGMTGIAALFALLVAVLQTPVTHSIGSRLSHWQMVAVGTGVTALALIAIGFSHSLVGAIGAILLFALGATLLVPGIDLVTSDMAPKNKVNSYFGSASLFSTVGMSTSAPLGAALMEWWPGSPVPWLIFGGSGLLLTGFWVLMNGSSRQGRRRPAA